jgi:LysM repeat protein
VIVTLGDTLTSISQRCNTSVEAFLEANPEVTDRDLIYVGQELAVPDAQTPDTPQTYVVKAGDTLTRIAAAFDVTVEALLEENPAIQDRNLIYVGQRLALPGAGVTQRVTVTPTSGPPGTRVHVSAAGFPANAEVQVGAGVVNSEFGIVEDARTDDDGKLTREIILPEFVEAGEEWVVVVRLVGAEIKGTSNRFAVTQPGQGGLFTSVNVYMVALGDQGARGKLIGCEDSLAPLEVPIVPTRAPLRAALHELLTLESATLDEIELYNALYRSELVLDDVTIVGGKATIQLSGTLRLGGACDTPRVEEQLRAAALQFSTVTEVEVWVNGVPLDEALSARG